MKGMKMQFIIYSESINHFLKIISILFCIWFKYVTLSNNIYDLSSEAFEKQQKDGKKLSLTFLSNLSLIFLPYHDQALFLEKIIYH
jgi:hypothetical protein